MQASEILRSVENAGGELWLEGESLRYRLPESASRLVDELRTQKWDLVNLLRRRHSLPRGLRLVRWEPIPGPVWVNRWLTVTNTERFIEITLEQVAARLSGDHWRAGNWSLSDLLERLEGVGVTVALVKDSDRLQ